MWQRQTPPLRIVLRQKIACEGKPSSWKLRAQKKEKERRWLEGIKNLGYKSMKLQTTWPSYYELVWRKVQEKARQSFLEAARAANLSSRLISLPAEVRLCIYEYCREDKRDRVYYLRPTKVKNGFANVTRKTTLPRKTPATQRRRFASLTQVCHFLRDEFLPLYKRENQRLIRMQDIAHYISTFHESGLSRMGNQGNLAINIHFFEHYADLLPLLKLKAYVPDFSCEFVSLDLQGNTKQRCRRLADDLNQLFQGHRAKQQEILDKFAKSFVVHYRTLQPFVRIRIVEHLEVKWAGGEVDFSTDFQTLIKAVGLDHMTHLRFIAQVSK
ncbi:hypothetical protein BDV96DRAFT_629178 [Lophiotrema nucula]|uniref:F-box domain-containing protein n=1 Tax=Lophiotrema nucula TaxID=690887 RepID=A0A6A5ZLB8_9PLEO|nr:hypothetical protein BDV96DRAFT_629178 [Lophiotrema nucula]